MENGDFVNSFNEMISQKLKILGINEFGFASIEEIDPIRAKTLPNAVSIVLPLSDYIIDEIDKEPTFAYFQHYRAVNAHIDSVLLQLGIFIQENGYKYMPIAASQSIPSNNMPYSAYISHKAVARASGLGTIGKNALFLSKRYGARVRLGTLLTDMPFDTEDKKEVANVCGLCNICKKSCPAMAITGNLYEEGASRESIIDAAACSNYMKKQYQHIGRGVVCGICMKVCPYRGEGK